MKLGCLEVSGITRVVENQKVVWNRYRDRWVKYIGDDIRGGMSMAQMNDFLNNRLLESIPAGGKYHIWVNKESINIVKTRK